LKKLVTTILCGMLTGLAAFSMPKNAGHVSAQTAYTYQSQSGVSASGSHTDSSYEDAINTMVANGTFDRSSLTDAQVAYINQKYGEDPEAFSELQKQSDYNSSPSLAAINTGSYSHDSQFDGYDVIDGIDISRWQGKIDWKKVKADGVKFAIIRVALRTTESGVLEADALYKENLQGAIDAGLDVGVYIYSQAISTAEAKAEADFTMNLLKGYDINLPIVMDFEYYTGNTGRLARAHLSVAQATTICNAFCKEVESKNYTAMVYANKSLLTNDVNSNAIAKNYQIWLAQYPGWDSATGSIHASFDGKYSYWQYTSSGSVDGIAGRVDMNFRYVKKPAAVKNLTRKTASMLSITLKWNKVPYAYGYQIYRLNKETGKYEKIGKTTGASKTTYIDKDLEINTLYSYQVRAYYKLKDGNYYGAYSTPVHATTQKKTVTNAAVSKKAETSLTITWDAQTEVSGYRISRLNASTGKYETAAYVEGASSNTWKDTDLNCGTSYSYKVRAYYVEDGKKAYFDYSNVATGNTKPGKVSDVTVSATKNSATIRWNPQVNVSGYKIYVKNDANKWSHLKTIKNKNTTSFTHTGLTGNKEYTYSVIAYYTKSGKNTNTDRSDSVTVLTKPAAVKNFKAETIKADTVKLTWKKESNIDGYRLYVKEDAAGSSWTKIATITSAKTTTFTQSGLTSNNGYKFQIKSYRKYNGKTYTGESATTSAKIIPQQVTNVKVKSYGSKQLLSWEPIKGVNGYYIYRYDTKAKKYKKIKTINNGTQFIYCINAKASSKYKYHVTAFNKIGKTVYKGKRSAAASTVKTTQKVKVACGVLNVRKGANTSSKILTTVTNGKTLTVKGIRTSRGTNWYKVSFKKGRKSYTGYVSADYVNLK